MHVCRFTFEKFVYIKKYIQVCNRYRHDVFAHRNNILPDLFLFITTNCLIWFQILNLRMKNLQVKFAGKWMDIETLYWWVNQNLELQILWLFTVSSKILTSISGDIYIATTFIRESSFLQKKEKITEKQRRVSVIFQLKYNVLFICKLLYTNKMIYLGWKLSSHKIIQSEILWYEWQ